MTTYFLKLLELSIPEFFQGVGVSLFNPAQTHVTDTIAHFPHI